MDMLKEMLRPSRVDIYILETHGYRTCCYCGKTFLFRNRTVEHFLPKALVKWNVSEDNTVNGELLAAVRSVKNMGFCCDDCNENKGCYIPTPEEFAVICKYEDKIPIYRELYEKCKTFIEGFNKMVADTAESQGNKCNLCGNPLIREETIIRRINWDGRRCRENAMCICKQCNANESVINDRHNDTYRWKY